MQPHVQRLMVSKVRCSLRQVEGVYSEYLPQQWNLNLTTQTSFVPTTITSHSNKKAIAKSTVFIRLASKSFTKVNQDTTQTAPPRLQFVRPVMPKLRSFPWRWKPNRNHVVEGKKRLWWEMMCIHIWSFMYQLPSDSTKLLPQQVAKSRPCDSNPPTWHMVQGVGSSKASRFVWAQFSSIHAKENTQHKNGGLEDDLPFQLGNCQVPW